MRDSQKTMGPYAYKNAEWVSFDDIDTIEEKMALLREWNLGKKTYSKPYWVSNFPFGPAMMYTLISLIINHGGWNKHVGVQKLQNQLDFFH